MQRNKTLLAIVIVFLVLLIDQTIKIWIKTTMVIGEEITVFNWFKIHFVENEGMAFGLQLGGNYGKFILSAFRIVAVFFLFFILRSIIHKPDTTPGLVASLSLILSGAIGNIIDSVFYGVIFTDSYGHVAQLFPPNGGYATLLHGRVVDMLHFPLYQGWLPHWLPIWGGDYFIFFRPVFNIADTAITLGVFSILLFQRNFFSHLEDRGSAAILGANAADETETNTILPPETETALLQAENSSNSTDYTDEEFTDGTPTAILPPTSTGKNDDTP